MEEELFPSDTALNTPIPHNCLHKIMHSQGFQEPVRVSVHTSYKKWQKSNILASQSLSRMWLWWSGQRNALFKEAGEGTRWIIDRPGGWDQPGGSKGDDFIFPSHLAEVHMLYPWERSLCSHSKVGAHEYSKRSSMARFQTRRSLRVCSVLVLFNILIMSPMKE